MLLRNRIAFGIIGFCAVYFLVYEPLITLLFKYNLPVRLKQTLNNSFGTLNEPATILLWTTVFGDIPTGFTLEDCSDLMVSFPSLLIMNHKNVSYALIMH